MLRHLGSELAGNYSSSAGAAEVLSWAASIGVDMTGAAMFDGSGLSYSNKFSARQVTGVVRHMLDTYTSWDDSLAIGCVDGTIGGRFCGTVGSGNVHAKTGTLSPVIALSGWIDNPNDGNTYLFSFIANNVSSSSATRQAIDDCVVIFGGSGIPQTPPVTPTIIVDNNDSGYAESGSWGTSSSSGYYGTNSRWAAVYNTPQNNFATWEANLPDSGVYEVFAWWVAGSNRSPGAAYYVNHNGGISLSRQDQQTNGNGWNSLGEYTFTAGNNTIEISSEDSWNGGDPNAVISADAIGFAYKGPGDVDVIVDNEDPGFTPGSGWWVSSSTPGYYGSNYRARATESTSDAAQWSVDLPVDGTYKVYAQWAAGSNRASSAPYIVTHDGGNSTVYADQTTNGGQWNELGTWDFTAGDTVRVKLSCWTSSGSYVIADAARSELQQWKRELIENRASTLAACRPRCSLTSGGFFLAVGPHFAICFS